MNLAISPTEKLLAQYQVLQLRKKNQKETCKWMTCEIRGKEICIEKFMTGEQLREFMDDKKLEDEHEACHSVFVDAITATGDHRYGIIDYKDRVFFVSYVSDTGKMKDRMVYASVRQSFKDALTGINGDMQCTDAGDLAVENFDKKVPKN